MAKRVRWGLWLARTALGIVCLFLIATLSRVPWSPPGSQTSVLRLSWRAIGERVQSCRKASAEELARLPAHMRQEQICEGRVAPFQLRVRVDTTTVITETITAAGARGDRPVYVLRELSVTPGEHDVAVEFNTVTVPGALSDSARAEPRATGFPAALSFRSRIALVPGQVVLITYDEDKRALVQRGLQD